LREEEKRLFPQENAVLLLSVKDLNMKTDGNMKHALNTASSPIQLKNRTYGCEDETIVRTQKTFLGLKKEVG